MRRSEIDGRKLVSTELDASTGSRKSVCGYSVSRKYSADCGGYPYEYDRRFQSSVGGRWRSTRLFQSKSSRERYFRKRSASFTLDRCARGREKRADLRLLPNLRHVLLDARRERRRMHVVDWLQPVDDQFLMLAKSEGRPPPFPAIRLVGVHPRAEEADDQPRLRHA